MHPVIFETPRLRLREWTAADEPDFQRIVSAPEVRSWFSASDEEIAKREPFIERMQRNQRELGWCLWAAELLRPAEDEPTGVAGYCGFGTECPPDPELGWGFLPSLWGRGYATEAGIACRDYGFEVLSFERIISVIHPDNLASRRVAEKVGLTVEGTSTYDGVKYVRYAMGR